MARTPRKKMLTLDMITKDAAQYDKKVKVTFDNHTYTEVYKSFSHAKIDVMLDDLSSFIASYNAQIGQLPDSKFLDYLSLHIIFHFSTLTKEREYVFEEKVQLFEKMLQSDLTEQIFEAFPASELTKVYERIFKKIEQYQLLLENNEAARTSLANHIEELNLENRDVINEVLLGTGSAKEE